MDPDTITITRNKWDVTVKVGDTVHMTDGSTRRLLRINRTLTAPRVMLGLDDRHVGAWFLAHGGIPYKVHAPSIDVLATAKALEERSATSPSEATVAKLPTPTSFEDAAFTALAFSDDPSAAAAVVWDAAFKAAVRAVLSLARTDGQYPHARRVIYQLTSLQALAAAARKVG